MVNSLCPARLSGKQEQHVIVGSASEFIYALTASGQVAWTTNLYDNVLQVAARDLDGDGRDEIVAATSDVLYVVDAAGGIIGSFATESKINCVNLGERLLIGTQDGKVRELTMVD